MTDVRLYKLINGEFILATLLKETQFTVSVTNVVRILVMPPVPGQEGAPTNVGFGDWCPFAKDKNLTLQKQHIMAEMEPLTDFLNAYQQQFAKIVTPPSGLILPPR
jgi:hypothetical protein